MSCEKDEIVSNVIDDQPALEDNLLVASIDKYIHFYRALTNIKQFF